MIRRLACMCLLTHALIAVPPSVEVTVFIEGISLPESSMTVKACDLRTGETTRVDAEGSFAQLQLRKDTEYLISLSDLPAGYMPKDELFVDTYDSASHRQAVIEVVPFDVRIYQCGVSRDDILEGGTLQLLNQQEEVLFEWHPQKDGRVVSENGEAMEFHAGETLILHQTEAAEGNRLIEDLIMILPEFRTSQDETFSYRFYPNGMQEGVTEQPASVWYEPAVYTAAITEEVILPEPEKKEVIAAEEETEMTVQSPPLVVSVFHQPEEKKEDSLPKPEASHPGFLVSFTDENGLALKDAQFCVLDQKGTEVDAWTADGQLHLVQNDMITAGTYIIRQKTAAPGYTKMSVDLEHTVNENDTDVLPVISIANRKTQTAAVMPVEKKVKNTAHWLVYAAGGTAAVCAGLAAFMLRKKKA